MKIERRKSRNAEVYTASLNDIMFFLLLFFLIISTMVTPSAIRVNLPNASGAKEIALKKTVQLSITGDLRYYLNNKELAFDQIEPELTQLLSTTKENEELNVILQADKTLPLQDVVDIINIGYKTNIKMVLVAKKN